MKILGFDPTATLRKFLFVICTASKHIMEKCSKFPLSSHSGWLVSHWNVSQCVLPCIFFATYCDLRDEGKVAVMSVERKRKLFVFVQFSVILLLAFTMNPLTEAVIYSVGFSIVNLRSSFIVLQALIDFTVIVGSPRHCPLMNFLPYKH